MRMTHCVPILSIAELLRSGPWLGIIVNRTKSPLPDLLLKVATPAVPDSRVDTLVDLLQQISHWQRKMAILERETEDTSELFLQKPAGWSSPGPVPHPLNTRTSFQVYLDYHNMSHSNPQAASTATSEDVEMHEHELQSLQAHNRRLKGQLADLQQMEAQLDSSALGYLVDADDVFDPLTMNRLRTAQDTRDFLNDELYRSHLAAASKGSTTSVQWLGQERPHIEQQGVLRADNLRLKTEIEKLQTQLQAEQSERDRKQAMLDISQTKARNQQPTTEALMSFQRTIAELQRDVEDTVKKIDHTTKVRKDEQKQAQDTINELDFQLEEAQSELEVTKTAIKDSTHRELLALLVAVNEKDREMESLRRSIRLASTNTSGMSTPLLGGSRSAISTTNNSEDGDGDGDPHEVAHLRLKVEKKDRQLSKAKELLKDTFQKQVDELETIRQQFAQYDKQIVHYLGSVIPPAAAAGNRHHQHGSSSTTSGGTSSSCSSVVANNQNSHSNSTTPISMSHNSMSTVAGSSFMTLPSSIHPYHHGAPSHGHDNSGGGGGRQHHDGLHSSTTSTLNSMSPANALRLALALGMADDGSGGGGTSSKGQQRRLSSTTTTQQPVMTNALPNPFRRDSSNITPSSATPTPPPPGWTQQGSATAAPPPPATHLLKGEQNNATAHGQSPTRQGVGGSALQQPTTMYTAASPPPPPPPSTTPPVKNPLQSTPLLPNPFRTNTWTGETPPPPPPPHDWHQTSSSPNHYPSPPPSPPLDDDGEIPPPPDYPPPPPPQQEADDDIVPPPFTNNQPPPPYYHTSDSLPPSPPTPYFGGDGQHDLSLYTDLLPVTQHINGSMPMGDNVAASSGMAGVEKSSLVTRGPPFQSQYWAAPPQQALV
eukprot:TRINITY_DN63051_c0_g1_i1.p1 TRINITY_DN63051_c0_g1~~TRINITY_DN63051_c0_g1_i1.p1  ORF type:complete len:983 (+),score=154.66 TRINITY_DN63051_c0_g1_i1:310-2949(+)